MSGLPELRTVLSILSVSLLALQILIIIVGNVLDKYYLHKSYVYAKNIVEKSDIEVNEEDKYDILSYVDNMELKSVKVLNFVSKSNKVIITIIWASCFSGIIFG